MIPYGKIASALPKIPRVPANLSALPSVPPPPPDFLYSGYTGLPGILETFTVLTVSGAAAWVGIHTGLKSKEEYLKAAGWVGGVGSALFGLLYLAGKSNLGWDIPTVRISPA